MKTINPLEVKQRPESTVVDVREYPEYAGGAISGSLLVPLGEVEDAAGRWRKDQSLVLVCRSGKRATLAAEMSTPVARPPALAKATE